MKVSGRWPILLALATVWVTTGGNFLGFKAALETIPPLLMMCVRLLTAGIILFLFSRLSGANEPLSRSHLWSVAAAGFLLLVVGQGAIVWGVRSLPAGVAAVLSSSSPLFLAAFTFFLTGEKLGGRKLAGLILGCCGLLLMAFFSGADGEIDLFGVVCVLVGAASWALGSLYESRAEMPDSGLVSGALQMLFAGAALLVLTFVRGEPQGFSVGGVSGRSLVGLGYLVVCGLVIGFGTFVWLSRETSPELANTFYYVSPVVAMALSAWLLGERITWGKVLAASVALAGVAFMVNGETAQTAEGS